MRSEYSAEARYGQESTDVLQVPLIFLNLLIIIYSIAFG